jgi:hypothetical protein
VFMAIREAFRSNALVVREAHIYFTDLAFRVELLHSMMENHVFLRRRCTAGSVQDCAQSRLGIR